MKKVSLAVGLLLCCAAILGTAGCQDIATDGTTTSTLLATTTSVAETTTSASLETTTTSASAAPGPAATTTTTVSSAGAPPGPQPKNKLIKGTWTWDVDKNVDGGGSNADLWYRIHDELVHSLEPQNGAGIVRISKPSFDSIDLATLKALSYKSGPLFTESVDDPDVLMKGDVFALRTTEGKYVKFQVTGWEPGTLSDGTVLSRYNIRLRYVLYP